ncbi:MAG: caspase family protein [Cyclobacteriaceae bacterium]
MRITLLILVLCSYCSMLSAQSIDISGAWIGTSTFAKERIHLRYELEQSGNQITGLVYSKNVDKNDSIKVRVEGDLKKDKIELEGIEIIYKTGLSCMANNTLVYAKSGSNEILTGRWKGDMKFNTCPPLVSGALTLLREDVRSVTPVLAVRSDQQRSSYAPKIAQEDELGQTLVDELSKRKYYALIIGNNQYQDENIQNLDNPINDAQQLAIALTTYYTFDQENVTVLTDASREDIIKSLDKLSREVTDTDNLLIFYAGHGIWNAQLNQGYWLPVDASMDAKSYWLSNSTLRDYVGGIKSKHTLLISDACFSGGILKERAVFENSRAILELYKLPSRKAMTSGTLKTVPDKSVFIQYLLKNLINNQAPLLSADQLFRTFKIAVINNSPNGQVPQYGPISQAGDEGGDFIFLKRN